MPLSCCCIFVAGIAPGIFMGGDCGEDKSSRLMPSLPDSLADWSLIINDVAFVSSNRSQ